jgi:hypothetical protein
LSSVIPLKDGRRRKMRMTMMMMMRRRRMKGVVARGIRFIIFRGGKKEDFLH